MLFNVISYSYTRIYEWRGIKRANIVHSIMVSILDDCYPKSLDWPSLAIWSRIFFIYDLWLLSKVAGPTKAGYLECLVFIYEWWRPSIHNKSTFSTELFKNCTFLKNHENLFLLIICRLQSGYMLINNLLPNSILDRKCLVIE